ncbi:hypothetical protein G3T37_00490 [Galbitalea soli]|uniref:Soluble ligand binding domain-containing protein n=2 Tax=Galbitalea soli TaxID=1268042 RepID=A0A7C9PL67_9MICO|nr:helix-hairpin-helix domain-containing protein [Galbitalea soli]NEM89831.1 hypothetical protein [Galbitalea soli]
MTCLVVVIAVVSFTPHGGARTVARPAVPAPVRSGQAGAASVWPGATAAPRRGAGTAANGSGIDDSGIYVHVTGQVARPGLYRLAQGDRVVDAIAAAGGFAAGADQGALNLARVVADGEQLPVPRKGATASAVPGAGGGAGAAGGALVNLNTADEATLETLDGVGPALAARILQYRAAHGRFASVDELTNVTGIGDKKFAAIKPRVTV